MDPDKIEAAKRACLKRSFGGALSVEEQMLMDTYLATDAGRQYLADSEEMKQLLHGVAEVRVQEPVDSSAMVAAFETMSREDLHRSQRRMPLSVTLTTGVCLLTGGLFLYSEKPELEFFAWTMIVCSALFALFFASLSRLHRRMLASEDLLAELDADRELGESPKVVTIAAVIALAFLGVVGYGIEKAGGMTGVSFFIATTVLGTWIVIVSQRRERQRNRELWDWWEGRGR